MDPVFTQTQMLVSLLHPETSLEHHLLALPDFQEGLMWGKPRFGHPEGKVAFHVREVLENINRIPVLSETDRIRLRLIAFAHDTFKYAEDRSKPRNWMKHHAMLARDFMSRYTDDAVVLEILETHDDAFYAWLASRLDAGFASSAHPLRTLDGLVQRMGHCLQTYYLFFKCDTQTGDKTQAPVRWFEQNVQQIEIIPIREKDSRPLPGS